MPRVLLAAVLAAGCFAAPARADDKVLTRIAFGSCADQNKPCPVWDRITEAKPDLLLLLGDTIYADLDRSKKVTAEVIKSKYDELAAVPGFQKLRAAVPMIAVWDDHDYGKNDAGVEFELKDESQTVFLDFFGVPKDSPRRARKGVYHAETYGPPGKRVQVIMLDGRYFRSPIKKDKFDTKLRYAPYLPNTDADATVLGEEQWKWLEEQLRQPAELRLLGSGIQVLSEDHGFEKWMNFPKERERLYKLIRDTKANGVIVLSGDRHLAELSVAPASAVGYPLYDFTSSGFNQASKSWRPPEKNRYRVAAMPYGDNFGLVSIDWASATSPKVTMSLRDEDGETVMRHTIRLGLLTPGAAADGDTPPKGKGKETPPAEAKPVPAGVLTPAEAAKKVGEEVTVQFLVKAARVTGDGEKKKLFLNSEADFKSDDNFTVLLSAKALAGDYKAATADTFKSQTVKAKGKVILYQKKPEIIIDDEKMIEVVK